MTDIRLINAELISWLAAYDGPPFHGVLTDPPYHLGKIVKRFGKGEPAHTKTARDIHNRSTPFARQAAGFLGQKWDGGDLAFQVSTWEAIKRLMLPGAFLMAFSGRYYHRMAVAIEDAGFVLHPPLLWLYGSGMPKKFSAGSAPFEGYYYGQQSQRPSVEFVALAQVPYEGKPRLSMRKYGTGAFNIDGCRLNGYGDQHDAPRGGLMRKAEDQGQGVKRHKNPKRRWPANVAIDEWTAAYLDRTTGTLRSGMMKAGTERSTGGGYSGGFRGGAVVSDTYGDSGGPSRYFYTAVEDRISREDPYRYVKKPNTDEKRAGVTVETIHPTVKAIDFDRWLATMICPPDAYAPRRLLVPFAGTATEVIGGMLAGWDEITAVEADERYCEIAEQRIAYWREHPKQPSALQLNMMDMIGGINDEVE